MRKTLIGAAALALALALAAGCAVERTADGAQRVSIAVTERGFVPARTVVKAGTPLVLAVTRRTDQTCATSLVLAGGGRRATLPLGETVESRLPPQRPGTLHYACGMDMVKGEIVVR